MSQLDGRGKANGLGPRSLRVVIHARGLITAAVVLLIVCEAGRLAHAEPVLLSATATSSSSMTSFGPTVSVSSPTGYSNENGTIVSAVTGTGGGAVLNTWATVSHALGATKDISMAWRTRTLNESFWVEPGGNPTQPPLQMNYLYFGMASDVLHMTGFAPGEKFVLQMSYVVIPGSFDEEVNRLEEAIHVSWLNPNLDGGTWVNAVYGNINPAEAGAVWNFNGSWADSGYNTALGSWGVDTINNVAWAVLDHNSQFAVAPEPSSLAMAGAAAAIIGLAVRRRHRGGAELFR